jgi:VanZ family protein
LARRRQKELFLHHWLPVFVYVAAIFVVSSRPNLQPPFSFAYADKLAHLTEYALLGLLLARAVRATMRIEWPLIAALLMMLMGMAVGLSDELFQSLVPGRQSSAMDFLADTLGLALAQLVYLAAVRD